MEEPAEVLGATSPLRLFPLSQVIDMLLVKRVIAVDGDPSSSPAGDGLPLKGLLVPDGDLPIDLYAGGGFGHAVTKVVHKLLFLA
jgi:hypothetical protein